MWKKNKAMIRGTYSRRQIKATCQGEGSALMCLLETVVAAVYESILKKGTPENLRPGMTYEMLDEKAEKCFRAMLDRAIAEARKRGGEDHAGMD